MTNRNLMEDVIGLEYIYNRPVFGEMDSVYLVHICGMREAKACI